VKLALFFLLSVAVLLLAGCNAQKTGQAIKITETGAVMASGGYIEWPSAKIAIKGEQDGWTFLSYQSPDRNINNPIKIAKLYSNGLLMMQTEPFQGIETEGRLAVNSVDVLYGARMQSLEVNSDIHGYGNLAVTGHPDPSSGQLIGGTGHFNSYVTVGGHNMYSRPCFPGSIAYNNKHFWGCVEGTSWNENKWVQLDVSSGGTGLAKQEVLDMLNKCVMKPKFVGQTSSSCNRLCADSGLTCIFGINSIGGYQSGKEYLESCTAGWNPEDYTMCMCCTP